MARRTRKAQETTIRPRWQASSVKDDGESAHFMGLLRPAVAVAAAVAAAGELRPEVLPGCGVVESGGGFDEGIGEGDVATATATVWCAAAEGCKRTLFAAGGELFAVWDCAISEAC